MYEAIRRGVSHDRLEAYRRGDDNRSVLTRYLWNMALSESLYPVLQGFEIVLRNSMHAALANAYRTEYWFDLTPAILHPRQQAMVTEAKSKLTDASKSITPGRIVAELNPGFWASLFNAYYEQKGASDPRLWPRLLLAVVPRMPRRQRTRRNLVRYLNDIRALRNRVFHHEPIWNLPALPQRHTQVLDFIGWINPVCREMFGIIDRFADTYSNGEQHCRKRLDNLFGPP
jgi:hypothetical protein